MGARQSLMGGCVLCVCFQAQSGDVRHFVLFVTGPMGVATWNRGARLISHGRSERQVSGRTKHHKQKDMTRS